MTKQTLRSISKSQRITLNKNEKLKREMSIFQTLRRDFDLSAKTVHCYLPIAKFAEIETTDLLKDDNVNWIIPKTHWETNTLSHWHYNNELNLETNTLGIQEPISGSIYTELKDLDLVIVPLLCFDLNGYRVGYGKGFYDRFLAELSPKTLRVGLSLLEPVDAIQDINSYDIKLTHAITANTLYSF